ncbi:hypothetical protein RugamoR57_54290 [Duganella caerulea]|uniref:CAAX prenyl protease-related protein n=1 Tax=Duganella caerulea TaxID=2885762 RepID=UPI0030E7E259
MIQRAALYRIAPFFLYMAFIVVADLAGRMGWSATGLRWLYPVKIGVVALALWCWRRHYSELRLARPGAGVLALSAAVGVLVLVLWVNLDAGWMRVGQSAGFDPRDDGHINWGLALTRLAGAALVVPLMEELFWRSYLLRWLDRPDFLQLAPASGSLRAAAITAVLFGVEHDLWLAGVVAGLSYGWLYRRTGNIWAPIVAHCVTNGLLGAWIIATGSWIYW